MRCLIDAEEWRPVVGYEEWYEVSSHGRVASLEREEDVIEIVSLLGTMPQTEIGKLFDVSNHTIHKIKCGKNWSWLTGLGKEGFAGAMSN